MTYRNPFDAQDMSWADIDAAVQRARDGRAEAIRETLQAIRTVFKRLARPSRARAMRAAP